MSAVALNELDLGPRQDRARFEWGSVLFLGPALALMATLPAEAEMFGPGFQPCGEKTFTLAVVECVQAKTNAAELAAQRLWVQYRDANCGFYGTQDGSIRQVQAAECMRSMTDDRARELEKAMNFD